MINYRNIEHFLCAFKSCDVENLGFILNPIKIRTDAIAGRVQIDGHSVFVKAWRRNLRRAISSVLKESSADREWMALNKLQNKLLVPYPVVRKKLWWQKSALCHLVISSDLGSSTNLSDLLREHSNAGDLKMLSWFESEYIKSLLVVLNNGLLDPDHTVYNCIVLGDGELARIDFELCRLNSRWLGRLDYCTYLISRIVLAYFFSVQPNSEGVSRVWGAMLASGLLPREAFVCARTLVLNEIDRLKNEGLVQDFVMLDLKL